MSALRFKNVDITPIEEPLFVESEIGESSTLSCGSCNNSLSESIACPVFESQSWLFGEMTPQKQKFISNYARDVERMLALRASLLDARSVVGQIAAITQFASSYMDRSVSVEIAKFYVTCIGYSYKYTDYLVSSIGNYFSNQSDDDMADKDKEIFSQVKDIFRNCKNFKTSPIATKMMKFLDYAIAAGLCGQDGSLKWTVNGFTIFHKRAQKRESTAMDILEYGLEVLEYFISTGYECFLSGSLSPFLFGDDAIVEFEKEYALLMSALPLLETGRLENLNTNEHDFDTRLEAITLKTQQMITETQDKFARNILSSKLLQLNKLRTQLIMCQQQGGIREKPFSILFFGKSGVGKSMLTNTTIHWLRMKNDLPGGMEHVVTLNGNDKFQSEFKTLHDTVILDDLANATKDTTEGNPTTVVIDFINNIIKSALNPEADKKGKVSIKPKFVMGTTNVKGLDAKYYSNEPVSIARRFDFTVTVSVKPEYRFDGSHMVDPSKVPLNRAITDIWELCVERVVPIGAADPRATDEIGYAVYTDNTGVDYSKCSLNDFLQLMSVASQKHFVIQKQLVSNNANVFEQKCCEHGKFACLCDICSTCKECKSFDNQFGFNDYHFLPEWLRTAEEHDRFDEVYQAYERTWYFRQLTSWLPMRFLTEWVEWNETAIRSGAPLEGKYFTTTISWMFTSFLGWLLIPFPFFWLNAVIHVCGLFIYETLRQSYFIQVFARVNSYYRRYMATLRQHRGKILFAGGTLVTVSALLLAYRTWKRFQVSDDDKESKAEDQIGVVAKDGKERIFTQEDFNPWKKSVVTPIPVSERSKSISVSELVKLASKSQCHVTIDRGDNKSVWTDAFLLCSNYAIIPNHVVNGQDCRARFVRKDVTTTCNNFSSFISSHNTIHIIGTDLAIAYVPESGSNKNMLDYFVNEAPKNICGELIYRDNKGTLQFDKSRCEFNPRIRNDSAVFPGHTYQLSENTFKGLCGATWIAHAINPYIMGFHLGGHSDTPVGCSGFVSRDTLIEFIDRLNERLKIVKCASSGTFMTNQYGVDFAPSDTIHPKSPTNFLTEEASISCYGEHPLGRTRAKSEVTRTIISDSVEKHLGTPNVWTSPPFMRQPNWAPWQKYLTGASAPAKGFAPRIVQKAYIDYRIKVKSFLDENPHWLKRMYKLNEIETISGIDGFRFVDKMVEKTSVGWPLNKSKKNYMEDVPFEVENITKPMNIDRMFWDEAYRMEECYLKGERCYPVFRSSLKDEPTKIDKEKSRVFQAAPLALQLLIRKYFLTLAHTLSKNPTVFELAVGVNCTGPEWHELTEFMCKFGKDRVVAGDFKAFDQHMPAQFTLLSFDILIYMAELAGYSEDDLIIMKGIATDVAYPFIELNGEFIELFGSNPSGQNLTVYINSLTNSLYHRCAYYTIYDGRKVPLFHDVMSLMTYGDDVKGSVKEGYDELNHTSISAALLSAGIEYTMADKTSESVPYIRNEDAGFLKRNAVWNDEVQMWFGPLEENSILKSLHSVLRSKEVTREEAAAINIDGALREYFYHGETVYEDRRQKLIKVAQECDISHMCTELGKPYHVKMDTWKSQYLTPEPSVV